MTLRKEKEEKKKKEKKDLGFGQKFIMAWKGHTLANIRKWEKYEGKEIDGNKGRWRSKKKKIAEDHHHEKESFFLSKSFCINSFHSFYPQRNKLWERERERGCPRGKLKILNKMTRQNGGEKRGEFGRVNGI